MPVIANGYSAWVQVDDKELEQFNVELLDSDNGKTVTCWIASEVGKVSG